MSTTKSVKLKGTSFFKPQYQSLVNQAVAQTHDIAHKASVLLKVYYLEEYEKNPNHIIEVDENLIKVAFNCCNGDKPEKLQIRRERPMDPEANKRKKVPLTDEEFKKAAEEKTKAKASRDAIAVESFGKLTAISKRLFGTDNERHPNKLSLSHVLAYSISQLETAYLNNVTFNFHKYVRKFANCVFGKKTPESRSAYNYLILHGATPSGEVLDWCTQHFDYLIGQEFEHIESHVETNPWFFLNKMVGLNILFETFEGTKLYSPIPIKRTFIPSHIRFDTSGLAQLLFDKTTVEDFKQHYKNTYGVVLLCTDKTNILWSYEKLTGEQDPSGVKGAIHNTRIWEYFCSFNVPKFKKVLQDERKDGVWVFDNSVMTDGVSITLSITRIENRKKKVHTNRKPTKMMFKKKEFQTISDLSEEELKDYLYERKKLSVDPGKGNIVQITNGQQTFSYTKGTRNTDIKTAIRAKNHNKKIEAIDKDYTEALSQCCSKSCNVKTFTAYVLVKFQNCKSAKDVYAHSSFRSVKFTTYCLTKSSEDKMIYRLKKWVQNLDTEPKYQWMIDKAAASNDETLKVIIENIKSTKEEFVLLYGNWGRNPNLKHSSPTPGIGLKRKLAKYFKILEVNEYLTSQTCPCCRGVRCMENPSMDEESRKVRGPRHQLLRCKNVDCSCRWWSRDDLGSYNIGAKAVTEMLQSLGVNATPLPNLQ